MLFFATSNINAENLRKPPPKYLDIYLWTHYKVILGQNRFICDTAEISPMLNPAGMLGLQPQEFLTSYGL